MKKRVGWPPKPERFETSQKKPEWFPGCPRVRKRIIRENTLRRNFSMISIYLNDNQKDLWMWCTNWYATTMESKRNSQNQATWDLGTGQACNTRHIKASYYNHILYISYISSGLHEAPLHALFLPHTGRDSDFDLIADILSHPLCKATVKFMSRPSCK